MADFALSRDPLERYGAIEQAYCDDRWGAVIQDGQSLLTELSHADPPAVEGLQERLQLLMAHAYLYGFGERDSAEDLYLAVLHSGAEATLRQIAEEGLRYCNLPTVAAPSPAAEPEQSAGGPAPGGSADPPIEASAASFWHDSDAPDASHPPEPVAGVLGEPSAAGAVMEPPAEPDHRGPAEVASAGVAPHDPLPQEQGILSWLNAEPSTAAVPPATGPVMPWLEEPPSEEAPPEETPPEEAAPLAPAVTAAAGPSIRSSPADPDDVEPDELGSLAPGDHGAAAISHTSDPGGTWLSEAISQEDTPDAPGSQAEGLRASEASPMASDAPQPMAPGAAEADGAVAAPLSLAKDDGPLAPPEQPEAPPSAAAPVPEAFTLPPGAMSGSTVQDRRMAEPARFPEAPLIPEVVDEPELIEVHQADPLRAEELEMAIQEVAIQEVRSPEQPDEPPGDPTAESAMGDNPDELLESWASRAESDPSTEEPAAGDDPPQRIRQRRSPRPGPFANPPQPVDEEEAEMLIGLLRVEMG